MFDLQSLEKEGFRILRELEELETVVFLFINKYSKIGNEN